MERSRKTGTCPFCEIIAGQRPAQPILHETDWWAVSTNINPESFSELHLVVAAKMLPRHEPDCSFDDLSEVALHELGPLLRDVARVFGITKGRSIFMRVGRNGDHNAQTVLHPHWHTVVSDGKPVEEADIPRSILTLLEQNRARIVEEFAEGEPELFKKAEEKGSAKVWSEALKFLWTNVALMRSFLDGKAGEIRPKFSNKAADS